MSAISGDHDPTVSKPSQAAPASVPAPKPTTLWGRITHVVQRVLHPTSTDSNAAPSSLLGRVYAKASQVVSQLAAAAAEDTDTKPGHFHTPPLRHPVFGTIPAIGEPLLDAPAIGDQELTQRFTHLQGAIDATVQALPRASQDEFNKQILPTITAPLPPQETESQRIANAKLREEEQHRTKSITTHLINLSAITTFNQFFFKNNPAAAGLSALNFYKKFSSDADPIDAFYKDLYKNHQGYYILAKIFIPIMKWFFSLIMYPKVHAKSGFGQLHHIIHDFFKDRKNIEKAILEVVNAVQTYFYKLNQIYAAFPKRADQTLTLEEYVKSELDKDQTLNPKTLYAGFNKWLANAIEIKCGFPIIGELVDKGFKKALQSAIETLDPIPMLFKTLTGNHAIDPTIGYNLLDFILTQLDNIEKQLKAPATQSSTPTSLPSIFNEAEKKTIGNAIAELVNFLPLEGADSRTVGGIIEQLEADKTRIDAFNQHSLLGKITRCVRHPLQGPSDWINLKQQLIAAIQDAAVSGMTAIAHNFAEEKMNLPIRIKFLNLIEDTFTTPTVTHDLTEYENQQKAVAKKMASLANQALDAALSTEVHLKKLRADIAASEQLLSTAKTQMFEYVDRLKKTHAEFDTLLKAKQPTQIDLDYIKNVLEPMNLRFLADLRDFGSSLQHTLNAICEFSAIDPTIRDAVTREMGWIALKLDLMRQEHQIIQEQLSEFAEYHPFFRASFELLPRVPVNDGHPHFAERVAAAKKNSNMILLGRDATSMNKVIADLKTRAANLSVVNNGQALQQLLTPVEDKIHNIHGINGSIKHRKQIDQGLNGLNALLARAETLHQQTVNRPDQNKANAMISQLNTALKQLNHLANQTNLANMSTPIATIKIILKDLEEAFANAPQEDLQKIKDSIALLNRSFSDIESLTQLGNLAATLIGTYLERNLKTMTHHIKDTLSQIRALSHHNEVDLSQLRKTLREVASKSSVLQDPSFQIIQPAALIACVQTATSTQPLDATRQAIDAARLALISALNANNAEIEALIATKTAAQNDLEAKLKEFQKSSSQLLEEAYREIQNVNARIHTRVTEMDQHIHAFNFTRTVVSTIGTNTIRRFEHRNIQRLIQQMGGPLLHITQNPDHWTQLFNRSIAPLAAKAR